MGISRIQFRKRYDSIERAITRCKERDEIFTSGVKQQTIAKILSKKLRMKIYFPSVDAYLNRHPVLNEKFVNATSGYRANAVKHCPYRDAIFRTGRTYDGMAALFSLAEGHKVLRGSVHHYLKEHPRALRKWKTAQKHYKERLLRDKVRQRRSQIKDLEARLKAAVKSQNVAFTSTATYLANRSRFSYSSSFVYRVFEMHHDKKNPSEIGRALEVDSSAPRKIIRVGGCAPKDGRGDFARDPKFVSRKQKAILRLVPVLGFRGTARRLKVTHSRIRKLCIKHGVKSPFKSRRPLTILS